VAAFSTGMRTAPHHSVEIKLSNGLIRLGHLVLNFSDRDVARGKSWTGSRKFGRRAVNTALIDFCLNHQPDVLLLGHADMIASETVAVIKDKIKHIRIGQWNVDPLFELDNVKRIKSKLDVVDATFITTAGTALEDMRDGGYSMSFMPNPADVSIERGRVDLLRNPAFDLFYGCGHPSRPPRQICGDLWDMNNFISMMRTRLPQLKIKLAGLGGEPHLISASYQNVLASSAIGLNVSRRPDFYLYSSDRIAQLAGNGCVVAMERSVGYCDYFGEDEMLFFSDVNELIGKLDRLNIERDVRMRMATAGRKRYLDMFNEQKVATHILAVLTETRAPEEMPW
jgi:hypothetical protein